MSDDQQETVIERLREEGYDVDGDSVTTTEPILQQQMNDLAHALKVGGVFPIPDDQEAIVEGINDELGEEPQTVLEEAQSLIYGDREGDYGPPTNSFNSIAGLWTAYLDAKYATLTEQLGDDLDEEDVALTPTDVAHMMILLKISRSVTGGKYKRDNVVDGCGYFALIARMEEEA